MDYKIDDRVYRRVFKANNSREIDAVFETIAQERFDGLFIEQNPFLNSRRVQLVQLAAHLQYSGRVLGARVRRSRWIDQLWLGHRRSVSAGRSLLRSHFKGAKPADLGFGAAHMSAFAPKVGIK